MTDPCLQTRDSDSRECDGELAADVRRFRAAMQLIRRTGSVLTLLGVATTWLAAGASAAPSALERKWSKDLGSVPILAPGSAAFWSPSREELLVTAMELVAGTRPPVRKFHYWVIGVDGGVRATGELVNSETGGGANMSELFGGTILDSGEIRFVARFKDGCVGLARLDRAGTLRRLTPADASRRDVQIRSIRVDPRGEILALGNQEGRPFLAVFAEDGKSLLRSIVAPDLYGQLTDARMAEDGSVVAIGSVTEKAEPRLLYESQWIGRIDRQGHVVEERTLAGSASILGRVGEELRLVVHDGSRKGEGQIGALALSEKPLARSQPAMHALADPPALAMPLALSGGRVALVGNKGLAPEIDLLDAEGKLLDRQVFEDAQVMPLSLFVTGGEDRIFVGGTALHFDEKSRAAHFSVRILALEAR